MKSKKLREAAKKQQTKNDSTTTDARFQSMLTDPIFKKAPRNNHKLKVDDRFKGVLSDDRFRLAPGDIDRYGRNTKDKKKSLSEDLQDFYEVEDSQNGESASHEQKDGQEEIMSRLDYLTKLSRGEISESSSEAEDDGVFVDDGDESEDDSQGDAQDDKEQDDLGNEFEEEFEEDILTGDISCQRLAVQNCDWEHIKAEDLMVVLQSFCPPGESVLTVTVYLSDFGALKIPEDDKFGPQGIWSTDSSKEKPDENIAELVDDNNVGEEVGGDFVRRDGAVGVVLHEELGSRKGRSDKRGKSMPATETEQSDINDEALRIYELRKLKYYFAVAEMSSVAGAEAVYDALDGVELGHSSMSFDLRYIPNDISFLDRTVRDRCHQGPSLETYEAPNFIVDALQNTTVKCSWETETGSVNRPQLSGSLSEWRKLAESDYGTFLASSSDEDDDAEFGGDRRAALRKKLLGDGVGEDEFFVDEEEEEGRKGLSVTYVPEDDLSTKKKNGTDLETPAEASRRKKEEKKRRRKEASVASASVDGDADEHQRQTLELMFGGDEEDESNDVDDKMAGKKKRRRKGKKLADEAAGESFLNEEDPRFQALFSGNPNFGIDTTDKNFKESEAMKRVLREQRQRRGKTGLEQHGEVEEPAVPVDKLVKKLKAKFGGGKI